MKKILNYNLFAIAALALLSSCNDDEASFTKSDKAVVTASVTSLTVAEGASGQVTLTLDKPLNESTEFKVGVRSGTGVFRDFTVTYGANAPIDLETIPDDGWGLIGYKLEIPAYTTTFTFDINAVLDFAPEAAENIVLELTPAGKSLAIFGDDGIATIDLTINNTVSNNFDIEMAWDASYADPHGTILLTEYTGVDNLAHDYCGFDFDLEIYDGSLSNVEYFDYDGCPAKNTIDATDPDGDYVIVPSFWTRVVAAGSVPKSGEIIYPVKVTMGKKGSFVHTTDLTGRFKYTLGGAVQGNPDAYIPVAIVTKTGTNYVLTDFDTAAVLGSGRYATLINNIKNIKKNKSKK